MLFLDGIPFRKKTVELLNQTSRLAAVPEAEGDEAGRLGFQSHFFHPLGLRQGRPDLPEIPIGGDADERHLKDECRPWRGLRRPLGLLSEGRRGRSGKKEKETSG